MLDNPQLDDSNLVRAARQQPVTHTPVWFMRQAGRSLPEYRRVREGIPMLESCRRPDLVAEITLQPVRRHGVDAAIFFSDIVVPLAAVGVDLDIKPGVGPVVAEPFRTRADLDRLPELTPEHVPYITEAVQILTGELGTTPLIGFAGAPFTLASYLVEGGPSKNHEHTKALMYGDPQLWDDLCARLAQISGTFLRVQASAGASAVQLFDSWVGALPRADYERFVQKQTVDILTEPADPETPGVCATAPNLIGMDVGDARNAWDADFDVVNFTPDIDDDARRVVSQTTTPTSEAGVTCLALTAQINVVTGDPWPSPPPPSCKVPSMIDLKRSEGHAAWIAPGIPGGFAPGNFSPTNGNFTIKSQSLVGGTWVPCSASVTVSANAQ